MDMAGLQKQLLVSLPKVDLHVHLDGSVKPETVLELAAEQGITLPADSVEGVLPYMRAEADCDSLKTYLSKFQFVLRFLQNAAALERTAYELVEQAAQENCIYMEVRFGPQLHTEQGLSPDDAIRAVLEGLKRGDERFGVTSRLIVICMRHVSDEVNRAVVEAAARFKDAGVVAADLAGDEASFPAFRFRELFSLARDRGLPVTIHAGEAAGPANIQEAVLHLGASRLGHGVRLREDRSVFELVRSRGIPLEMCPVSNIQTKAVSGWQDYPLADYLRQGLKVIVNTDNRTVSGTTLAYEYEQLIEHCGLGVGDIAAMILIGLDAAFVEAKKKEMLKRQFMQACEELGLGIAL